LGGLNAGAFEVSELLSRATFDYIIIETVGVGQSELDIAGLADCTILTLVPESGDDIQAIKSGIMEIADLYVINKSDRDGADILLSRLKALLMHDARKDNIVKTVASSQIGIEDVFNAVHKVLASGTINQERKTWMFANRLWQQIAAHRLKDISLQDLQTAIKSAIDNHSFNYYTLLKQYTEG
jgi:LAO/AO transport system kinase